MQSFYQAESLGEGGDQAIGSKSSSWYGSNLPVAQGWNVNYSQQLPMNVGIAGIAIINHPPCISIFLDGIPTYSNHQ